MSYDVNEVSIIGRLGADPEVKSFQNGGQICNLRVATSESWKDKGTGERSERTEWHSVTLRNDHLIKFASENLRKGSRVYVRGKLQTRKWQDQSGSDRYSTEVVVAGYDGKLLGLEPRQSSGTGQSGGQRSSGAGASQDQRWGGGHQTGGGARGGGSGFSDDLDDDIPF